MTRGALIFAYNNEKIDYVRLAAWSTRNIHRHLDIPVCLVTDKHIDVPHPFDQIVVVKSAAETQRHFVDFDSTVTWHNSNRVDAYEISPWDETLVLDADYVVASNLLSTLFDSPEDFICHRWAYDVTGLRDFQDLNYFGRCKMPMWWATVIKFTRSHSNELLFGAWSMVKNNWTHYRHLYGNPNSAFRNDHAMTIALNIVNGHTLCCSDIPWNLASVTPDHRLSMIEQDHYRVDFVTPDLKKKWIDIKQDFHAMGKRDLGDIIGDQS